MKKKLSKRKNALIWDIGKEIRDTFTIMRSSQGSKKERKIIRIFSKKLQFKLTLQTSLKHRCT